MDAYMATLLMSVLVGLKILLGAPNTTSSQNGQMDMTTGPNLVLLYYTVLAREL